MKTLVRMMTIGITTICLMVISCQYLFVEIRKREFRTAVITASQHVANSWARQAQELDGLTAMKYKELMETGNEYVERLNFPISDLGGKFEATQFEMDEGTGRLNEKPDPDYVEATLNQVTGKEEVPEGTQYQVVLNTKGYVVKGVYLLTDGYEEEAFYVDDEWYISTDEGDNESIVSIEFVRDYDANPETMKPLYFYTDEDYLNYFEEAVRVQINSKSIVEFKVNNTDEGVISGYDNVQTFTQLEYEAEENYFHITSTEKDVEVGEVIYLAESGLYKQVDYVLNKDEKEYALKNPAKYENDVEGVDVDTGALNITVTMTFKDLGSKKRTETITIDMLKLIYSSQSMVNKYIGNVRNNYVSDRNINALLAGAGTNWTNFSASISSDWGKIIGSDNIVRSANQDWYYNDGTFHLGTDYAASKGTPVLAPADGYIVVSSNGCDDGYLGNSCGGDAALAVAYGGNQLHLLTIVEGHLYEVIMFHMVNSSEMVKTGYVSKGETIGYVGTSGNSTGAHLHVEIFDLGRVSDINPEQNVSSSFGMGWGESALSFTCDNTKNWDSDKYPCRLSAWETLPKN